MAEGSCDETWIVDHTLFSRTCWTEQDIQVFETFTTRSLVLRASLANTIYALFRIVLMAESWKGRPALLEAYDNVNSAKHAFNAY